jgi:hypothetical protein
MQSYFWLPIVGQISPDKFSERFIASPVDLMMPIGDWVRQIAGDLGGDWRANARMSAGKRDEIVRRKRLGEVVALSIFAAEAR